MDFVTHALVGRLLAHTVADGAALGWLVTVFAVLPDVDTVSWFVPGVRKWVRHRGWTHSLLFGVVASALAGALFAWQGWSGFFVAFGVAMLGFLSHVGLDVLNWGCSLLAPFRDRRVEYTVHAGAAVSLPFSVAGLVALAVLPEPWPRAVSVAILAFGALYFAFRFALKRWATKHHPGRRLFPTGNPLVWLVCEEAMVRAAAVRVGRPFHLLRR